VPRSTVVLTGDGEHICGALRLIDWISGDLEPV
jgi:hypothetical protein